jgi:hypothetical protein
MGIANFFGRQRRCYIFYLLLHLPAFLVVIAVDLIILFLLPLLSLSLVLIKDIGIQYRAH